jgi:hypothetical protein
MIRWLSIVLGLFALTPVHAQIKAGAFAMDVTPRKFPISVNGGMADRQATRANDPLHARCLVLDDGSRKLALVVVDSCMLPTPLVDAAKRIVKGKIGIGPESIVISATHTHSAPTVAGVFQSDPDEDYTRYLAEKIAEGILTAHERRTAAQVGWGVGSDSTQLFNRRWKMKAGALPLFDPFDKGTDKVKMNPGYQNPGLDVQAGPTDPEITILSVQSADGRPLALFANYGLHYVGGYPELSADYFGAYANQITRLLGADKNFVAMMSNGTSGDVNNVNFAGPAPGKRMPGEQIEVVARSVAQATLKAVKAIKHRGDVKLASAQRDIELAVRKPSDAEIVRAKDVLAKAKDPKNLKGLTEVYARETVLLNKFPDRVTLHLQAHRIGELGIATIPCEVFTEIGLDIKARSPLKPTCTISLANGYNGYLPTPGQHALGGYETWRARSSYLEVDASPKIVATLLSLIGEVGR